MTMSLSSQDHHDLVEVFKDRFNDLLPKHEQDLSRNMKLKPMIEFTIVRS